MFPPILNPLTIHRYMSKSTYIDFMLVIPI